MSEKGLQADHDKVAAIAWMAPPDNIKDLGNFLRMTGYYCSCINYYAQISDPLVHLTHKGIPLVWTADLQLALDTMKEA